jgi:Tfp pilus assembly protein PilP
VTRGFINVAAGLMTGFIIASPVSAQTQGQTPKPQAEAAAPAGSEPAENQGYAYRPEGRRDPFISLMRRGNESAIDNATVRPAGLAGIGASELTLRGIMQSRGGYVALVQGVDSKTYIVKPGDKLFDGTIRAITANAMMILQQVNDPLSLDKQRELRKVLRQTDEVK